MTIVQSLSLFESPRGIAGECELREHKVGDLPTFFLVDPSQILTEDLFKTQNGCKHISDLSKLPSEAGRTFQIMDSVVSVMKNGCQSFSKLVGDHQMLGLNFGEISQIKPHGPFIIDSPNGDDLKNLSNLLVLNVIKEPADRSVFPFPWINIGYYEKSHQLDRDIVLDNNENFADSIIFRQTNMNPLFGRVMIVDLLSTHKRRELSLLMVHRNSDTFGITEEAKNSLSQYSDFLLKNPQFCDGGFIDRILIDKM